MMVSLTEKTRSAPGAELFIDGSVASEIANTADDAYFDETDTEGLLIGSMFVDRRGTYGTVKGISADVGDTSSAVGWFRSSEDGCAMSQKDISRHMRLFGKGKAYAIMVDAGQSSMAMYTVEDGVAVKVSAVMTEGL